MIIIKETRVLKIFFRLKFNPVITLKNNNTRKNEFTGEMIIIF